MSYGIDVSYVFHQAATYVDRILRGNLPAELPVQGPTKLGLVINLKTAKALGLEVPPDAARARRRGDRVRHRARAHVFAAVRETSGFGTQGSDTD